MERRALVPPPPRVCDSVRVCVCVYLLVLLQWVKLPPRNQAGIKCNVDKAGTQRHISADEIIPP